MLAAHAEPNSEPKNPFWQKVYDARTKFYEEKIGQLPNDIAVMSQWPPVWPGGGLFIIPAQKLQPGLWAYSTFGLSNPDMPSEMFRIKREAPADKSRPGYGYEMLVVAAQNAEWPLKILQWAANTEILGNADFLGNVEKSDGITVEQVRINDQRRVNVLISKAQAPLPTSAQLPNGKMQFLVATIITDDEMRWSMKNGRGNLLKKLKDAGIGQRSVLDRPSVLAQPSKGAATRKTG
jgi:hypothetical protein